MDAVEDASAPLRATPLGPMLRGMAPLDAAKTNAVYAYALTALSYAVLRMKGVGTQEHPVSEELQRVKAYFGRIKDAQESVREGAAGKADAGPTGVDTAAAGRMVRAALGKHSGAPAAAAGGDSSTPSKGKKERGTKRARNDDNRASGREYSRSRRSESGIVGEASQSTKGRRSGNAALGVAPKRAHLNWKEGLKARSSSKKRRK